MFGRLHTSSNSTDASSASILSTRDETLAALTTPVNDPVTFVQWQDSDEICVCDVDFHGNIVPDEHIRSMLRDRLPNVYLYSWVSKRGLKAVYSRIGDMTAQHLAAVAAAVALRWSDYRPTVEIMPRSRPILAEFAHTLVQGIPVDRFRVTRGLFVNNNPPDTFAIGERYEHDLCPIDPKPGTANEPLVALDGGLYCHRCNARGLTYSGVNRPGFVPWSKINGSENDDFFDRVERMAEHWVHWAHAKLVLEALGLTGLISRLFYEALLYSVHEPTDTRQKSVFVVADDFVWRRGGWFNPQTGLSWGLRITKTLAKLPAVKYEVLDKDEAAVELKTDAALVEKMINPAADLEPLGYYSVGVVRGCRTVGVNPAIILPYEYPVQLVSEPAPVKDLQSKLQEHFPGVSWKLLTFLVSCRMLSERNVQRIPLICISGVSGSGKTSTVKLAADICGDRHAVLNYTRDGMDRFVMSLRDSAERATYLIVDEWFKFVKNPQEAGDSLLSISPTSSVRMLYVGNVPFNFSPVIVCTDVAVPAIVATGVQVPRRFVYYKLNRRVDWPEPCLRAIDNELANHILSYCVQTYQDYAFDVFQLAEAFGLQTLEQAFYDEIRLPLLRFYDEWLKAPDVERRGEKGWRRIRIGDETSEISVAWDSVVGDGDPFDPRRIAEIDWGRILGQPLILQWHAERRKQTVWVKFTEMNDATN